jgi:hypothetical protein
VNGLDAVEGRIEFPEFITNSPNVPIDGISLHQTLSRDIAQSIIGFDMPRVSA